MMKLMLAFRNFANAPKKLYCACTVYLWVSCDSKNKQRLFNYTELADSLENEESLSLIKGGYRIFIYWVVEFRCSNGS
jgi:hypothetical protein